MTIDIQPLIAERPHLKDPFEFYAKCQRFLGQAAALLPKRGAAPDNARAYPPVSAVPLLRAFASVFDLAPDSLSPLGLALQAGKIDFLRLPLGEVPALPLAYPDEELAALLFLLSRPFFLGLHAICVLDGREWEGGRCPLCSARPALSSIVDGPRRQLHCSWCGTTGPYRFIGCPNCGSEDANTLGTLAAEGEAGFRVATCDACQTYVKVVDDRVRAEMTTDLADLASLPLDIVTQEKGYLRRAPNPIGLLRIA